MNFDEGKNFSEDLELQPNILNFLNMSWNFIETPVLKATLFEHLAYSFT